MAVCRMEDLMSHSGVRFGTSGARGLVAEMSDEVCYAYAAAFLQSVAGSADKVVLGHDLRPSSPRIAAACAAAIQDTGREVIYAGALPTPALAFYAAQLGAPALVVTGSHIPFDRNGIKFYRAEGEISKADEQAMLNAVVDLPEVVTPVVLPIPNELVCEAYVSRYLDFFGSGMLAGLRVAVYEHSSVARDVLFRILEALGAEVISLGRTDTFVPIDTEAVRPEDVAQARQWAQEYTFDAIVSTDGDADRPLIGDEQGQWLRGDVVGILCAQYLQAQVVVTPVSSNTAVEKCGSFTQVVRQGRRLAALPTRDAVLPMLALLSLARERGCKLSQLSQNMPARYTASDRLQNFATEKSQALISQFTVNREFLTQTLAPQSGPVLSVDQTDGMRVTFESGDIVHLRPSGNAPELRCYAEAGSPERAKLLCDSCLQRILLCP